MITFCSHQLPMPMVGSVKFLMKNSSKPLDTQLTPWFPIFTVLFNIMAISHVFKREG